MDSSNGWDHIVPIDDIDRSRFKGFTCGLEQFDTWLLQEGRTAVARGECQVHVCIDTAGLPVAFFTLSSTSINSDDLSGSSRGGIHGQVPATLLGKLGVRSDLAGKGLGTRVLHHAMQFALDASAKVSSRLLVVDARDNGLVSWYIERGFVQLPSGGLRLVCKMSKIKNICNGMDVNYFTV